MCARVRVKEEAKERASHIVNLLKGEKKIFCKNRKKVRERKKKDSSPLFVIDK